MLNDSHFLINTFFDQLRTVVELRTQTTNQMFHYISMQIALSDLSSD